MKNVLLKNLSLLEKNVFNVTVINILTMIRNNAQNATTDKHLIKTFITAPTLKITSKLTPKKHQI